MERDSGARNVGPREARVDYNPFNVKQSDMDMEVNFHSTPHMAYNSQKLNTWTRRGDYTEYSDDVKARNPFVEEGRRLTWKDQKSDSGKETPLSDKDSAVAMSYKWPSSQKGRMMRKSEGGIDWPPSATSTGYGLPLTPMNADQFAASALSMTLDTNTSAYSEAATGIDVSKGTQTATKADAPKLGARSKNPFDLPLAIRPKKITSSTEATRTSAVELHASGQQQQPDTLTGKNGLPPTTPLMQHGEHAGVTLPSSKFHSDYDHLSRSLEHPPTR